MLQQSSDATRLGVTGTCRSEIKARASMSRALGGACPPFKPSTFGRARRLTSCMGDVTEALLFLVVITSKLNTQH